MKYLRRGERFKSLQVVFLKDADFLAALSHTEWTTYSVFTEITKQQNKLFEEQKNKLPIIRFF